MRFITQRTLNDVYFHLRLLWNRLIFWTFPTPEETYYGKLGSIYYEHGNFQKAISLLLKAEELNRHREADLVRFNSYYLGHSYLYLGDLKQAIEHLERYARLNRRDVQVASLIGSCHALLKHFEEALTWYELALALDSDMGLRVDCAMALHELGRKNEALEQLEKAGLMATDPLSRMILEIFSRKVSGDFQGAIELLEGLISDRGTPWNPAFVSPADAFNTLVALQRAAGDREGALKSLESAFARNRDELMFMNELAAEYAEREIHLEEALGMINRALECQPLNPLFLSTKGLVLSKLGRRSEAKTAVARALDLLPDHAEIEEQYRALSGR